MGQETRDTLLSEGLQLFLQEGYAAIGIKRIVDAAGVPKGSFYHFFPGGKEQFAAEVVDVYAERAAEVRQKRLLEGDGAPLARLRAYFEHYARHFASVGFKEGCLLGNLSGEIADLSDAVRDRIAVAFDDWEEDLDEVVSEAIADGAIPSTRSSAMIARHLIHGWEGALLRMKVERSSEAMDEFIALTFDAWLAAD